MYNGIRELDLTQQEFADFIHCDKKYIIDTKDMLVNEYLVVKLEGEYLKDQAYKLTENRCLIPVKYEIIENKTIPDIKPRNIKQQCYFDLLNNKEIKLKVVTGGFGVGKSFVSTAWALKEIQLHRVKKLVIIRNNVDVADVPGLGALPGSMNDKLSPYYAFIGDIIGQEIFEFMITRNQIEIAYLGTIRGRSFMDSIVLCSEAQNLTTDHIKLIVSRIGENSSLIFDFDLQQKDRKIFSEDNGMMSLVTSLAGHKRFGMVALDKVERSEIAELAELIKLYVPPKKTKKTDA